MSSIKILRGNGQSYGRGGRIPVSRSKFYEDFVLKDSTDPCIPGTTILRVRPVPLGGKCTGFVEHELDAVNAALVKARDVAPLPSK
jgi:hypothetical protein